ncbi:hypothetical protein GHI93_00085 [Lactococcus hircilactis]|uniref:HTH-type transcriptional regulator Rgg C-terminal domain-containing protein n=1 Tax=Lactococcus hircilactis TaxID=1494462 RepID=A0A7X1Z6B8_9LACT|nr:hypothetical protein [Lactococcus hircilactis]MQW38353.1 hypothetical protein [Lactococcus hircilactis]
MENEAKKELLRKSYGEVFQILRETKHISQTVAAGGKTLQGNLSRFEKGGNIPAVDTFFNFLLNIKVDPAEYFHALNNHLVKKDIFLYVDMVGKAYTLQDAPTLEEIIKNLENQEKDNSNLDKFTLDRIMAEAVLSLIDPEFKIPKTDADRIRDYLKNTRYWGYYELRLLGWTSRLFDFIQLTEISDRVIFFATKNEVSPHVKRQIILCELNILDSLLLQKQYTAAKSIIKHLEQYGIPENFYYEKSGLVYLKAKCDYLTGHTESLETMKAHLSALELYGCTGTAAICREEIEDMIKHPNARGLVPYDREDANKEE